MRLNAQKRGPPVTNVTDRHRLVDCWSSPGWGGTTFREAAESADSLIAEADRALYEAKEAGRDHIVIA